MTRRPVATIGIVVVAALLAGGSLAAGSRSDSTDTDGSEAARQPPAPAPPHEDGRDPLSEDVGTGGGPTEGDPDPADDGGVLAMWAPGGLDRDLAAAAEELPDVVAATLVRSDTLGLVGSRDVDGQPVDELADGFRIPVDVVALDPDSYTATNTSPEARDALAALAPGKVLLSASAAELRGIGVGGEVDLLGLDGLEVAGILPDGVLRRAEIIVLAEDADAIGLPARGSLLLRHTAPPGPRTELLIEALEGLGPDDQPARVVGTGRPGPPLVLSLLEKKERFGEFAYRPRPGVREIDIERSFLDEHVVTVEVPILGNVQCHRAIVDDLRAALGEVVEAGLADSIDPGRYGGCFYARRISPDRDRLSSHSWGISIDINVDLSLPGLGPVPPDEVIEIFGRHGFRWGGDFIRPDNHHYEWIGPAAADRPER